ncbi:MAG: hypothetical protein NZ554_12420 [Bryobacteraceae bacterium]|nr:hypothetical protein [Bryobacteraceae bacterium]
MERDRVASIWVTAREYARLTGLSMQTLANWRSQDRKAGRQEAAPGKPVYRRFGRAVRYLVPAEWLQRP